MAKYRAKITVHCRGFWLPYKNYCGDQLPCNNYHALPWWLATVQSIPRLPITVHQLLCNTVVAVYRGKRYRDEKSLPRKALEISASGCRVFSSGDCSMVKGRKGQHGVGLAVKEEIVKKAVEDGRHRNRVHQRTSPEGPEFRLNQISLRSWEPTPRPRKRRRGRRPNTWQPSIVPWHQCPYGNTSSF